MNKDFDFNEVGKRMPFRTPEGFFEKMQAETMVRIKAEKRRKKLYRLKIGITAVLSAAAIWCGVMFFFPTQSSDPVQQGIGNEWLANVEAPMELYLQQMSDEELEAWIEFSENDIYYELMNENVGDYEED